VVKNSGPPLPLGDEYWGLEFDSGTGCIRAGWLRKRRVRDGTRLQARP